MLIFNIFTVTVAVIGAVLGIINTIYAIFKDKVKLRVIPEWAKSITHDEPFHIEINGMNVGFIPVTVQEVGFYTSINKKLTSITPISPDTKEKQYLPYRIEARSSFRIAFTDDIGRTPVFKMAKYAYASNNGD